MQMYSKYIPNSGRVLLHMAISNLEARLDDVFEELLLAVGRTAANNLVQSASQRHYGFDLTASAVDSSIHNNDPFKYNGTISMDPGDATLYSRSSLGPPRHCTR